MSKLEVLKWIATVTLIVGFGLFSAGVPEGWYLQIAGGIIWLTVSIIMKDSALIVTNGAMTTVGIIGKLLS
jgi:hypothetical protein